MRAGLSARIEATANIRECRERFQASRIAKNYTHRPNRGRPQPLNPGGCCYRLYSTYFQLELSWIYNLFFFSASGQPFSIFPSVITGPGTRKLSWQWFVAIHLPVIVVIVMRLVSGVSWHAIPFVFASDIAGQLAGRHDPHRLSGLHRL